MVEQHSGGTCFGGEVGSLAALRWFDYAGGDDVYLTLNLINGDIQRNNDTVFD